MKILVVEDEKELLQSIIESLQQEQFVIESADSLKSASEKLALYDYDCILLDIMLPGGSGLLLLEQMKNEGKSENVIIISAKDALQDKLRGLELGADDYLTKPFHMAELTARIKAVLRRKHMDGKKSLDAANLSLDPEQRQVRIDGIEMILNRKEFDILNYFLLNQNRLVTKTALAEHVWGDHIDQAENLDFIYYQIKNLRKKLQHAQAGIEIEAVYGIGYKLFVR